MRKVTDVYIGSFIYKKVTRKKGNTIFLFLPDNDSELNYYAIEHIGRYADIKGFTDVEIICSETIYDDVLKLSKGKYKVTSLNERHAGYLLSYILLKSDAMGILNLANIRLITLRHPNTGLNALLSRGAFNKEYLVRTRMLCRWTHEYEELTPATPFKEI